MSNSKKTFENTKTPQTPFYKKRKFKVLLIILFVLIVIRLFLPVIVLHYANRALADMDGYYGHVKNIDMSLYRGAYQLVDIYINKVDSATQKQIKFFDSQQIDLSVEWRPLFHGAFVGKLKFDSPSLIFTKDKAELSQVKNDTTDFRIILKKLMPLRVDKFEINNGTVHYTDTTANPKVDIFMKNMYMIATNLKNVVDKNDKLPSFVKVHADVYGGTFDLAMRLDALAQDATFDLNAGLKNTNLADMNDFLRAYGGFDIEHGTFGMYSEMAADNGKFKGYVKPFFENLKVLGPQDRHDSFFQKAWEAMVGAAALVFKNRKEKDVATKVPIEGNFHDPRIGAIEAVWEILKNAFISALLPQIDNEINISSVQNLDKEQKKGILQKIFSNEKNDKEKNKKSIEAEVTCQVRLKIGLHDLCRQEK